MGKSGEKWGILALIYWVIKNPLGMVLWKLDCICGGKW